jgi:hypothetical protein
LPSQTSQTSLKNQDLIPLFNTNPNKIVKNKRLTETMRHLPSFVKFERIMETKKQKREHDKGIDLNFRIKP